MTSLEIVKRKSKTYKETTPISIKTKSLDYFLYTSTLDTLIARADSRSTFVQDFTSSVESFCEEFSIS